MKKFLPSQLQRPLKDEPNLSILEKISNGDSDKPASEGAFNEFYHRFHRYVWNVTYRVCSNYSKDTSLAEDLFQEVFKKVYLKVDLLIKGKQGEISDGQIKAWLGTIANNLLMDHIRDNNIEKASSEFIVEVHDGYEFQPSESEEQELPINHIRLGEAIGKLSAKERDILYLYLYKTETKVNTVDLKLLAAKYNIKPDTIRKTYYRIIEELKKQLQP